MLLLRALLLWSLVALHVAGGAVLFRRLFPRESAWFGLIAPALVLCVTLNFAEHFVAFPSLLALLPLTALGSVLLLVRPDAGAGWWHHQLAGKSAGPATPFSWDELRLPLAIFLVSFAYAFFIRCLGPSIHATSDGLVDLNLLANFLQGGTLPPTDAWLPPFKLEYYYTFQHYAASVLARLLGVGAGTGYNLGHALLSAFICTAAAATAWRATGRAAIAWLMPLLIAGVSTGSSAYLWLTERDPSPWVMSNLSGGLTDHDANPIWRLLATAPYRERLELQVPGYWMYRDEFHSNAGGHLVTLLAVWLLFELLRDDRRVNWPWIGAALVPFLTIVTSTWSAPLVVLFCGGGLILAWMKGRRPENPMFTGAAIALGLVGIWPTLMPLFNAPDAPSVMWNRPEWRTPPWEFLFQWWPILVLWLSLLPGWRQLSTPAKWAHAVVPLMLLGIECFNIEEGRYNTIEKMWGCTYGAGLVALFPIVASRRAVGYRVLTGVLLLSAVIALYGWVRTTLRWTDWAHDAWHVEGDGILRLDPQRARLLQIVSQLHRATLLPGRVIWDYNDSPALEVFSGNRCYVAWFYSEERFGHRDEAHARTDETNKFYAGTLPDPRTFLLEHGIDAAVIWPDDQIPDTLLAALKQQLAPQFDYVDAKGAGPNNAGVFLRVPSAGGETPTAAP